jgi:uncharacterized cupredoxin-like copper-binding protein
MRSTFFTLLCMALALVAASCGKVQSAQEKLSVPEKSPDIAPGPVVQVTLRTYGIDMPESIPAGNVTFIVTNEAQIEHNFEIRGNGVDSVFPQNLASNQTRRVTVMINPGEYTVLCPVHDHAGRGMKRQIQAGAPPAEK